MKSSFIRTFGSELKRMIGCSQRAFWLSSSLCVFDAMLSLSYTVCLQQLIEALEVTNNVSNGVINALWLFGFFALLMIVKDVNNAILNYQLDKQQTVVQGALEVIMFEKTQFLPVLTWEDPRNLDMLDRAKSGVADCVQTLISTELLIGSSVVYIFSISYYLCNIHPLLSFVVLSFTVPTFFSYILQNKVRYGSEEKTAVQRRKMQNAEDAVCSREFFKETRHLGTVPFFINRFRQSARAFQEIKVKENRFRNIINFCVDLSYFLGFLISIIVIIRLTQLNKISISEIAAIIATIQIINGKLKELFEFQIGGIVNSYTGLKNLHTLLCFQTTVPQELKKEPLDKLTLENISFRYPNSQRDALHNVSLTIHSGETVCIVGENGSGKSTLSKILLGLYPATDGKVWLNNKLINENNLVLLQNHVSAIFQKFNRYALSLSENLTISNIHSFVEKSNVTDQVYGMDEIAQSLPDGYSTMLSKEFDGVDLSQGQWQRIAITRGILRKADILVLDEPTSAIDPMLEYDLLTQILNNRTHSTKVIITHRLGIATKADRIVVMKAGEIVEIGTHSDLMSQNGEYAQMFKSQSNWYQ